MLSKTSSILWTLKEILKAFWRRKASCLWTNLQRFKSSRKISRDIQLSSMNFRSSTAFDTIDDSQGYETLTNETIWQQFQSVQTFIQLNFEFPPEHFHWNEKDSTEIFWLFIIFIVESDNFHKTFDICKLSVIIKNK